MKKQILNIGKNLNRAEQKEIFGGFPGIPLLADECSSFDICSPLSPHDFCAATETCTNLGTGYICICTTALINY
jgi:hypothetical protein